MEANRVAPADTRYVHRRYEFRHGLQGLRALQVQNRCEVPPKRGLYRHRRRGAPRRLASTADSALASKVKFGRSAVANSRSGKTQTI